MLVRLLIYIILGIVLYRAARSLFSQTGNNRRPGGENRPEQVDDVMIKDPVCGVYFPQSNAVALNEEGRVLYFCSIECRDRYLSQSR